MHGAVWKKFGTKYIDNDNNNKKKKTVVGNVKYAYYMTADK